MLFKKTTGTAWLSIALFLTIATGCGKNAADYPERTETTTALQTTTHATTTASTTTTTVTTTLTTTTTVTTAQTTTETTLPETTMLYSTAIPVQTQETYTEAVGAETVHLILNTDTGCVHLSEGCRAAKKILPENYSEIDIAEGDLANYAGQYWACGICCSKYSSILPKIE